MFAWCFIVVVGLVSGAALFPFSAAGQTAQQSTLFIELAGEGRVVSDPSGIDCNASSTSGCSAEFLANSTAVLYYSNTAAGFAFSQWSGACAGSGSCAVTMDQNKSVTATFTATPTKTITVIVSGPGTIISTPPGIECRANVSSGCSLNVNEGVPITLNAILDPTAANASVKWSGAPPDACSLLSCFFYAESDFSITTNFRLPKKLTVVLQGSGSVASIPEGIRCRTGASEGCSALFPPDSKVTLSYTNPDLGFGFSQWSGQCDPLFLPKTCVITMDQDKSVTAIFASIPTKTITVAVTGQGRITSFPAGLDCRAGSQERCSLQVNEGASVTLNAASDSNYIFSAWSGTPSICSTTSCGLGSVTNDLSVNALFVPFKNVTVTLEGVGAITSSPAGINCRSETAPAGCSAQFAPNSTITLYYANPPIGFGFSQWSGACTGSGSCVVTMDQDKSVTATFTPIPTKTVTVSVTGPGKITSSPAGLDCRAGSQAGCSLEVNEGTSVVLYASPDSGYIFSAWSGAAQTCAATSCNLGALTSDISAGVTFVSPKKKLTVSLDGVGSITSNPGFINCSTATAPTGCSVEFAAGAAPPVVELFSRNTVLGSAFSHWSGACTGSERCVVTVDQEYSVTAHFIAVPIRIITVAVTGSGRVTLAGTFFGQTIDCREGATSGCSIRVNDATNLVFNRTADSGHVFSGWSGVPSCATTLSECRLDSVNQDFSIGASFAAPKTVTIVLDGSGSVTSSPGGINCRTGTAPAGCSAKFASNTNVTLYYSNSIVGFAFNAWSGSCIGTATCPLTLDQDKTVTAAFVPVPTKTMTVSVVGNGRVYSPWAPTLRCREGSSAAECSVTVNKIPNQYTYPYHVYVEADSGYTFSHWTGAPCAGQVFHCYNTYTYAEDMNITATFVVPTFLTVSIQGAGTVSSSPSGLSCATTTATICRGGFASTTVSLYYNNSTVGFKFSKWSGPCDIRFLPGRCDVVMDQEKSVSAEFVPVPVRKITITPTGPGQIYHTPAGKYCRAAPSPDAANCVFSVSDGNSAVIYPIADTGFALSRWSGPPQVQSCSKTNWSSCSLVAVREDLFIGAFFALPDRQLSVSIPSGSGTVRSDPPGINCASGSATGCSAFFTSDAEVELSAVPPPLGFRFSAWSGACSGSEGCIVTMNQNKSVSASFAPVPVRIVTVAVTGAGKITSSPGGIECRAGATTGCALRVNDGTLVNLYATADLGYIFSNIWNGAPRGGACSGSSCSLDAVNQDFSITTSFVPPKILTVSFSSGSGTVRSDPSGINCASGSGTGCSAGFAPNSVVTLESSNTALGFGFSAWSGECAAFDTCTIIMDRDTSIAASFNPIPTHTVSVSVTGNGRISASAFGQSINCRSGSSVGCSLRVNDNGSATFQALPDEGYLFSSWSQDAQSCLLSSCALDTLTHDISVGASFVYPKVVRVSVEGKGRIVSSPPGIDCGSLSETGCYGLFLPGSDVALIPRGERNHTLAAWGGACSGGGSCVIALDHNVSQPAEVSAEFGKRNSVISVTGPGKVTIGISSQTSDEFLTCASGSRCVIRDIPFDYQGSLGLYAVPDQGSRFEQWTGSNIPCGRFDTFCFSDSWLHINVDGTAHFSSSAVITATTTGVKSGKIVSSDNRINCAPNCEAAFSYDPLKPVPLTAIPDAGAALKRWFSVAFDQFTRAYKESLPLCVAMNPYAPGSACAVNTYQSVTVGAEFGNKSFSVIAEGPGRIVSNPAGIDCRNNACESGFSGSVSVTLTPEPDAGAVFWGWTEPCPPTGTCTLTTDVQRSVKGIFAPASAVSTAVSSEKTINFMRDSKTALVTTQNFFPPFTSTDPNMPDYLYNGKRIQDGDTFSRGNVAICAAVAPSNIQGSGSCTATYEAIATFDAPITLGHIRMPGATAGLYSPSFNGNFSVTAVLSVLTNGAWQEVKRETKSFTSGIENQKMMLDAIGSWPQSAKIKLRAELQGSMTNTRIPGSPINVTAGNAAFEFSELEAWNVPVADVRVSIKDNDIATVSGGGGFSKNRIVSPTYAKGCSSAGGCIWTIPSGAPISLFPIHADGQKFLRWLTKAEGDPFNILKAFASCAGPEPCSFTPGSQTSIIGEFAKSSARIQNFIIRVQGPGRVKADGIDCPGVCTTVAQSSRTIPVYIYPDPGFSFSKITSSGISGCSQIDAGRLKSMGFSIPDEESIGFQCSAASGALVAFTDTAELSVSVSGSGRVRSSPAGIDCPLRCSMQIQAGSVVTLTPLPDSGSTFLGWSSLLCGSGPLCTIRIFGDTEVSANFGRSTASLSVSVYGPGRVSSTPSGIDCPSQCAGNFHESERVILVATPHEGKTFLGWSGACLGRQSCTVTFRPGVPRELVRAVFLDVPTIDIIAPIREFLQQQEFLIVPPPSAPQYRSQTFARADGAAAFRNTYDAEARLLATTFYSYDGATKTADINYRQTGGGIEKEITYTLDGRTPMTIRHYYENGIVYKEIFNGPELQRYNRYDENGKLQYSHVYNVRLNSYEWSRHYAYQPDGLPAKNLLYYGPEHYETQEYSYDAGNNLILLSRVMLDPERGYFHTETAYEKGLRISERTITEESRGGSVLTSEQKTYLANGDLDQRVLIDYVNKWFDNEYGVAGVRSKNTQGAVQTLSLEDNTLIKHRIPLYAGATPNLVSQTVFFGAPTDLKKGAEQFFYDAVGTITRKLSFAQYSNGRIKTITVEQYGRDGVSLGKGVYEYADEEALRIKGYKFYSPSNELLSDAEFQGAFPSVIRQIDGEGKPWTEYHYAYNLPVNTYEVATYRVFSGIKIKKRVTTYRILGSLPGAKDTALAQGAFENFLVERDVGIEILKSLGIVPESIDSRNEKETLYRALIPLMRAYVDRMNLAGIDPARQTTAYFDALRRMTQAVYAIEEKVWGSERNWIYDTYLEETAIGWQGEDAKGYFKGMYVMPGAVRMGSLNSVFLDMSDPGRVAKALRAQNYNDLAALEKRHDKWDSLFEGPGYFVDRNTTKAYYYNTALNNGQGGYFSIQDLNSYQDPSVANIVDDVEKHFREENIDLKAMDELTMIRTVYRYLYGLNILQYVFDTPSSDGRYDNIQLPYQTLVRGGGDCDDFSVLVYSIYRDLFFRLGKQSAADRLGLVSGFVYTSKFGAPDQRFAGSGRGHAGVGFRDSSGSLWYIEAVAVLKGLEPVRPFVPGVEMTRIIPNRVQTSQTTQTIGTGIFRITTTEPVYTNYYSALASVVGPQNQVEQMYFLLVTFADAQKTTRFPQFEPAGRAGDPEFAWYIDPSPAELSIGFMQEKYRVLPFQVDTLAKIEGLPQMIRPFDESVDRLGNRILSFLPRFSEYSANDIAEFTHDVLTPYLSYDSNDPYDQWKGVDETLHISEYGEILAPIAGDSEDLAFAEASVLANVLMKFYLARGVGPVDAILRPLDNLYFVAEKNYENQKGATHMQVGYRLQTPDPEQSSIRLIDPKTKRMSAPFPQADITKDRFAFSATSQKVQYFGFEDWDSIFIARENSKNPLSEFALNEVWRGARDTMRLVLANNLAREAALRNISKAGIASYEICDSSPFAYIKANVLFNARHLGIMPEPRDAPKTAYNTPISLGASGGVVTLGADCGNQALVAKLKSFFPDTELKVDQQFWGYADNVSLPLGVEFTYEVPELAVGDQFLPSPHPTYYFGKDLGGFFEPSVAAEAGIGRGGAVVITDKFLEESLKLPKISEQVLNGTYGQAVQGITNQLIQNEADKLFFGESSLSQKQELQLKAELGLYLAQAAAPAPTTQAVSVDALISQFISQSRNLPDINSPIWDEMKDAAEKLSDPFTTPEEKLAAKNSLSTYFDAYLVVPGGLNQEEAAQLKAALLDFGIQSVASAFPQFEALLKLDLPTLMQEVRSTSEAQVYLTRQIEGNKQELQDELLKNTDYAAIIELINDSNRIISDPNTSPESLARAQRQLDFLVQQHTILKVNLVINDPALLALSAGIQALESELREVNVQLTANILAYNRATALHTFIPTVNVFTDPNTVQALANTSADWTDSDINFINVLNANKAAIDRSLNEYNTGVQNYTQLNGRLNELTSNALAQYGSLYSEEFLFSDDFIDYFAVSQSVSNAALTMEAAHQVALGASIVYLTRINPNLVFTNPDGTISDFVFSDIAAFMTSSVIENVFHLATEYEFAPEDQQRTIAMAKLLQDAFDVQNINIQVSPTYTVFTDSPVNTTLFGGIGKVISGGLAFVTGGLSLLAQGAAAIGGIVVDQLAGSVALSLTNSIPVYGLEFIVPGNSEPASIDYESISSKTPLGPGKPNIPIFVSGAPAAIIPVNQCFNICGIAAVNAITQKPDNSSYVAPQYCSSTIGGVCNDTVFYSGWQCNAGFYKSADGTRCLPIVIGEEPPIVDEIAKPFVDLSADPARIDQGGSVTLTWTTRDATSCTASGGWTGAKSINGTFSQTVSNVRNDTTYTLRCSNAAGSSDDSVLVTVRIPVEPNYRLLGNGRFVVFQTGTTTSLILPQEVRVWGAAEGGFNKPISLSAALVPALQGVTVTLEKNELSVVEYAQGTVPSLQVAEGVVFDPNTAYVVRITGSAEPPGQQAAFVGFAQAPARIIRTINIPVVLQSTSDIPKFHEIIPSF